MLDWLIVAGQDKIYSDQGLRFGKPGAAFSARLARRRLRAETGASRARRADRLLNLKSYYFTIETRYRYHRDAYFEIRVSQIFCTICAKIQSLN